MTLEAEDLVNIVAADPATLDPRRRGMHNCVTDLRDGHLLPADIIQTGIDRDLDEAARAMADVQWGRGYLEIGELIDAEDTVVLPALDACTEAGA